MTAGQTATGRNLRSQQIEPRLACYCSMHDISQIVPWWRPDKQQHRKENRQDRKQRNQQIETCFLRFTIRGRGLVYSPNKKNKGLIWIRWSAGMNIYTVNWDLTLELPCEMQIARRWKAYYDQKSVYPGTGFPIWHYNTLSGPNMNSILKISVPWAVAYQ